MFLLSSVRYWELHTDHTIWRLCGLLSFVFCRFFFFFVVTSFLLYLYRYFIYVFPQLLNFRKTHFYSEEVLFWIKNEISLLNPLSVLVYPLFHLFFIIYIYEEKFLKKHKIIQNLMNLSWESTLNISFILTFFKTLNSWKVLLR